MPSLPLILASSSPRRRQLLAEARIQFTVIEPRAAAEDAARPGETPRELVARLALQKAGDVADRIQASGVREHPDGGAPQSQSNREADAYRSTPTIIIGCDTVAACGGQILGKPDDEEDARRMLQTLRGQEHEVYSGLCLWRRPGDQIATEVEITRLIMDPISDAEIDAYLATGAWRGKAGAFGYQDGIDWVHIVEGSESNVVGLPLELLRRMIREMNK